MMQDVAGIGVSGVTVALLGQEITLAIIGAAPPNFNLQPLGNAGDSVTVTRYFVVGDGTVASVLETRNQIRNVTTGVLTGKVTVGSSPAAGAEVAVLGNVAEGPGLLGPLDLNVVNHTVTDTAGAFSLTLAPGQYRVVANLEGHPYEGSGPSPVEHPVTITAAATTMLPTIKLPATGALQVFVADGTGTPIPAKVSVVGFDPSPPVPNTQSIVGVINNSANVFRDRGADGRGFGLAHVL